MTHFKSDKRPFKTMVVLFAMIATSLLAGCNPQDKNNPAHLSKTQPVQPAQSEQERVAALVTGNTMFALDLQRELFDPEQNQLFSPWSLSQAVAMTYAGARKATEQQIESVMHFHLPQEQLHPAFKAIEREMSENRQSEPGDFRLTTANAMWIQQDFPILDSYLNATIPYYNAAVRQVNFLQPEETRRLINLWGSDQTEERIRELIPSGVINGETALVLTNAVCFKAAWKTPFRQHGRYQGEFQLLDGSRVTTLMMAQTALLSCSEQPNLQVVELPYKDDRFSMVFLLPAHVAFESFLMELNTERLSSLLDDLKPTNISLEVPPFNSNSNFLLKETLQEMGMIDAFREADFSGITGDKELFIRDVCHGAFINVDENGTEAAAGTAVVVERKSAPRPGVRIALNRPFIYLIRDNATGTILFLGHIVNPNL